MRRILLGLTRFPGPSVGVAGTGAPSASVAAVVGAAVVAVVSAALSGPGAPSPAGRDLPPFRSVEVWDLGDPVTLNVHANLPQRVTIEAPEGGTIRTEVRGETLVVSGTSAGPVEISIALPEVNRLVLWGDTHARVRAVRSQDLAVTLSDTASIEAEGVVARLELVADAQGRARLHALAAGQARVTASGASRVDLQVKDALDATVGDHAGVFYVGSPEVRQLLRSSGTVTQSRPEGSNAPHE